MPTWELARETDEALQQVLGYLNFSSGSYDPQLFANLNELYQAVYAAGTDQPAWTEVGRTLRDKLNRLQTDSPAFRDAHQARAALDLLLDHILPGYLQFHRDLLFHQDGGDLFNSFFVGRACEALLLQPPPWDPPDDVALKAIRHLNDYLGHRPVATLESRKIEPYEHEWLRPVPIFIRDVGAAAGAYHDVVTAAVELLDNAGPELFRAAHFDPTLLSEIAFDPRSYDFDHPANKRPNYHFGQWDPHHIDSKGQYRRFVVQQVTLDALMSRIDERDDLPRDEMVFEAASVLAGTVLMASGISGSGPDTHDSTVSFANLLPRIAAYRDAFYEQLFTRLAGQHAERLAEEARELRQPFGGARQHLNATLARHRASQLEHVHLATVFAQMGFPDAATREADIVPVASARILCRIDCRLTSGHRAMDEGKLEAALGLLDEIMDRLQRAIDCGAVIDPWNILGFDARFSLFPAPDCGVHDHRADDLLSLMDQIFEFCSRLWSESAARDDQELSHRVDTRFKEIADWWRKFAVHAVSSVSGIDAGEAYGAAKHVAQALNLWHKSGAAAGDVGFWANHAEMFNSPKAYALVIDALLEQGDLVASMALLIHWLGQTAYVELEQGESSFHQLAVCWLSQLHDPNTKMRDGDGDQWRLTRKFLDYIEANAEDYWHVPEFELGAPRGNNADAATATGELDDDEDDDLFSAAYEDVVYRDSTDDGVEGAIFDSGSASDDELEREAARLVERLEFHDTLARMWKTIAIAPGLRCAQPDDPAHNTERAESLHRWAARAAANCQALLELIDEVKNYRIAAPLSDHESMLEYDQRRLVKDTLLEQIVSAAVEQACAARLLQAACSATCSDLPAADASLGSVLDKDQSCAAHVFALLFQGRTDALRDELPTLIEMLGQQPLLYVPLAKGGDPRKFFAARVRQNSIADLLGWLPRVGLLDETRQLIETARQMERSNPVGVGAVTEFDELFKIGFKAICESLVDSSATWPADADDEDGVAEEALVAVMERTVEAMLVIWLKHSRTLRLSVLEKVADKNSWQQLVTFIETYGGDLFTQRFFNLGNIRAILHQGVDEWLTALQEDAHRPEDFLLLDSIGRDISRELAVEQLTLVLEAIVENYGEYRDYNSTTTQSDRGELLYTLLDFLRLRVSYDRISWNLKPVVWAHEVMVRRQHNDAAKAWRIKLNERIREQADKFAVKLIKLQKKHAMRMPTVADRIGERFMHPLLIDRIRALVKPAIEAAESNQPSPAFDILQFETNTLTREPTGVGLDVPTWLLALHDEVERVRTGTRGDYDRSPDPVFPQTPISLEDVNRQISDWATE